MALEATGVTGGTWNAAMAADLAGSMPSGGTDAKTGTTTGKFPTAAAIRQLNLPPAPKVGVRVGVYSPELASLLAGEL